MKDQSSQLFFGNQEPKKSLKPAPLAYLCSPKNFEEFYGQEHILGEGKLLRRAIESDRLGSGILFGPPGTGKSALARLVAVKTQSYFSELNAVTAGVQDLRKEIESSRFRLQNQGQKTILLLDEIHHFNKSQQDALLPDVERGIITLIGLTTENPHFYVNAALRSRSQLFEFFPLSECHLEKILERGIKELEGILKETKIKIAEEAKKHWILNAGGDARRILNALEIAVYSTQKNQGGILDITLQISEESLQKKAILYDKSGDEHYDTISAFIKSMRGGDPDAALYWMAKMIEAGEDPRFIIRRAVICASEDVGNADPNALILAAAALDAIEFVGMPEARIILAQAVAYISCAPKSNAAYLAIENALSEVKTKKIRQVPNHLKDASLDRESRGHGKGYRYPHDYPGHWVRQEYMPDPVHFYNPTESGAEKDIKERLDRWRKNGS